MSPVLLERIKRMLTGGPPSTQDDPAPEEGRARAGARWEKRAGKRVKWKRPSPGKALVTEAPVERTCPRCGAPMLAEWGANCPVVPAAPRRGQDHRPDRRAI